MRRPRFDTGITAMAWIAAGAIMKQFIEAFLRIDQRTLCAGQFEPELHFSPCRHPVCFNRSLASPLKSYGKARNIIDFDGAPLRRAGSNWAALDQGFQIGIDVADGAEKKAGHSDDMAADIGNGAGSTAGIQTPIVGSFRIRHVVFRVNAAKAGDFSKLPSRNHGAR